jgi:hypothetical protein
MNIFVAYNKVSIFNEPEQGHIFLDFDFEIYLRDITIAPKDSRWFKLYAPIAATKILLVILSKK